MGADLAWPLAEEGRRASVAEVQAWTERTPAAVAQWRRARPRRGLQIPAMNAPDAPEMPAAGRDFEPVGRLLDEARPLIQQYDR